MQVGQTVLATHATVAGLAAELDDLASYLVVVEEGEPVARHALGAEPLTVGRDLARDIVLNDGQVSRLHLQVALVGGEVVVEDLGSSNGTFLDGQRLAAPAVLPPDSWVQVGTRLLKHERRSAREVARAEELHKDLEKARSYVQSLLPPPITTGPVRTDWHFCPSTQLGGDAFSVDVLDDDHLVAYLIDVSGHGTGAAMHSVSVLNVLRQRALPGTDFHDPGAVLAQLNEMFQMEAHDGMYFTIWYGVYSRSSRRLAYASAGHHPAFLYAPGGPLVALRTPGLMIGAMPGLGYGSGSCEVPGGAVLYLFSDGVFEVLTPDRRQLGLDDFLPLLGRADAGQAGEAGRIHADVRAVARRGALDDDFSLLAVSIA